MRKCLAVSLGSLNRKYPPSAWQRSMAGWCDSSSSSCGSQNSVSRPHGTSHGAAGSQQLACSLLAPWLLLLLLLLPPPMPPCTRVAAT
jgi:hypothetical protein